MCGIIGYIGDKEVSLFSWRGSRSWNTADTTPLVSLLSIKAAVIPKERAEGKISSLRKS